jgi:acylphosphatase
MSDQARVRLTLSGLVQGVAFRALAAQQAVRLGITGWVRNLPDGRVEALAEGDRPRVEAFTAWCRRGPPFARVDAVEESWEPHRGDLTSFDVRRGS